MPWRFCLSVLLLFIFTVTPEKALTVPVSVCKPDTGVYKRSQSFYDSLYHKFYRKKFTQLLYGLAFVPPQISSLPDSMQVIESQIPYIEYKGNIIRNITIKVLPPFGYTIYDTADNTQTGIGKAFNNMHVRTREYIIRRNLLFRRGQMLDPQVLGDNERIIRDLESIDNVRILVIPAGNDSVDLLVIAKDVWSIGFDVPVVTTTKVGFRIYDANFLGLGDRLTLNMSTELYRAPFFRFDGGSYTFTNILGTFIDAGIAYNQDNTGNQLFLVGFDRPFFTNKTKWAGGTSASWVRNVTFSTEFTKIATRYKSESLWIGKAFLLTRHKQISRFVAAVSLSRREYSFRPERKPDSTSGYSNNLQFLCGLSFSQNNYYVTDYLFEFGKTENLPFGKLFQVTFGPTYNEFYTRFYAGVSLSAGNFIPGFGYLQGYIKLSGFIRQSSLEDGVVKLNLRYFTPLIRMSDPHYKFRTFISADYRTGINMRPENLDYYNANDDFSVIHLERPNAFFGTETFTASLSTNIFTPWYVYGFRFALTGQIQAGLAATKNQPLWKAPLFAGFGVGIMIKNENLVFPTFLISGYLYPVVPPGVPSVLGNMSSVYRINMYDFNVGAPHQESLGN